MGIASLTGVTLGVQAFDRGSMGTLTIHEAAAIRVVIMSFAGISLGMLALIVRGFTRLHIDKTDRLMKPLGGLCISYFLMSLFICLELTQRLNNPMLTWRTPFAAVTFGISLICLYLILKRLRPMAHRALATNATVKVTAIDTGKPGQDIDLGNNNKVI